MTVELYKNQLLQNGLVDTRAAAISEAILELHKAFAACDLTNRGIVRSLFANLTVDQMITDFARTEDLNKEIFDQDAEPLEDRIYFMVKERMDEEVPYQVLAAMKEHFQKFDFSQYIDDYIEAKIDRILEEPVHKSVSEALRNVKLVIENE
tara:strand:+ start:1423 stop:1875 length:453 start_codon:yes stop_codon:yes gene_type:complete